MPLAEVISEEKLLPRSVLRESNGGNSFPISVVTAGLHPILHSFHLPSLMPPPTHRSHTQSLDVLSKGTSLGLLFLSSNPFQAQALASGKSKTLVQTTPAHGQHCIGGHCSNQRNFADFLTSQSPVELKLQAGSSISATHQD